MSGFAGHAKGSRSAELIRYTIILSTDQPSGVALRVFVSSMIVLPCDYNFEINKSVWQF